LSGGVLGPAVVNRDVVSGPGQPQRGGAIPLADPVTSAAGLSCAMHAPSWILG